MEPAKIVLRALLIFCGYGAVFGLVTSWLSPEAYTLARPPAFGDLPPPALGALWGLFDFLTCSAAIGIGTAFAAYVGDRPAVKAFFFTKPFLLVLVIVVIAALFGGGFGYWAAKSGNYEVVGNLEHAMSLDRHAAYVATWWAYLGSLVAMLVGGATMAVWTWRKRIVFEQLVRERGY